MLPVSGYGKSADGVSIKYRGLAINPSAPAGGSRKKCGPAHKFAKGGSRIMRSMSSTASTQTAMPLRDSLNLPLPAAAGAVSFTTLERSLAMHKRSNIEVLDACPLAVDVVKLRQQVQAMYQRVAVDPRSSFHFNTGIDFAVESLGYDRATLEALPALSTARFAGVGNPHRAGHIPAGATVLDHACGAGMDLLVAAQHIGPEGRIIGVDMTRAMLEFAGAAAREAGFGDRAEFHLGLFEALPVADASVDVVLSNGVLNLAPDKPLVMREIVRVLRPGGALMLADVVVDRELSAAARGDADLWAACVGGAVMPAELIDLATQAGLEDARLVESFDCFRGTAVERKFGRAMKVKAVSLIARKRA